MWLGLSRSRLVACFFFFFSLPLLSLLLPFFLPYFFLSFLCFSFLISWNKMWYQFESFGITLSKPKLAAITRKNSAHKALRMLPSGGHRGHYHPAVPSAPSEHTRICLHRKSGGEGGRENYTRRHISFLYHTVAQTSMKYLPQTSRRLTNSFSKPPDFFFISFPVT